MIVTGELSGEYRVIGPIQARVTAKTVFSKDRTTEEVDAKLQVEATRRGANAVINVAYDRSVSLTSWKALTARGVAVVASPEARPVAAPPAASVPSETALGGWHPDPSGRHQLRFRDGQHWTEHVSDAGNQTVDPP